MKRNVFIFLGTFIAGAVIAFGARAALHNPHAAAPGAAASVEPAERAEAAAAPAGHHGHADAADHAAHGTAGHGASHGAAASDAAKPAADVPVNTVCAICGMKVNPKLPTETYQGKKVGFGCAACPPLFRENPDKYGPAALRNEVVED